MIGGTNTTAADTKPEQENTKKTDEFSGFEVISEEEVIPEGDTILSNVDTRNQLLADLNEVLRNHSNEMI